jgi:hypothetical protein
VAVVLGLLFKNSPDKAHETKPEPRSLWGLALQTVLSAWLAVQPVRILGKQWTYKARVMEGHELVTRIRCAEPRLSGNVWRHPGAGLVFARWWTLPTAMILFLVGNRNRIHAFRGTSRSNRLSTMQGRLFRRMPQLRLRAANFHRGPNFAM